MPIFLNIAVVLELSNMLQRYFVFIGEMKFCIFLVYVQYLAEAFTMCKNRARPFSAQWLDSRYVAGCNHVLPSHINAEEFHRINGDSLLGLLKLSKTAKDSTVRKIHISYRVLYK